MSTTQDVFCSVCYNPIEEDSERTLRHVLQEHTDHDELHDFIDNVGVREYCRKCGSHYWSDVTVLNQYLFGARPCCPACRENNRAFRDLMTVKITPEELVARGVYCPTERDEE